MVVVMPDGDDSFYTTMNVLVDPAACRRAPARREPAETYCVAWGRYDEYVARDLVRHVDTTYRTRADRAHRAVAGLSMGGYGAVTLALRYPDVFTAAASHSGVVSMMQDGSAPFAPPPRYATSIERLREKWSDFWPMLVPAFGDDTAGWLARDPTRLVERALASGAPVPALWLDAGTGDDLVIDQNRAFHWELARLGVAHEWRERPGRHDWAYWRANAPHSLGWLASRIASPVAR
jgi:S-formylglutathione hydrolase FrmB